MPLPAYPVARIRTGADRWEETFPFRPTYEAAYRAVSDRYPVHTRRVRRVRLRTYAHLSQTACPADAQARFFLPVAPVNVNALPAPRRPHGSAHPAFDFARRGARFDQPCVALASWPDYPIARIRTGQFTHAGGALWEAERPLAPRARDNPS